MSVLNGEAFLRPAINSVLQQTFGDFELIVVDNHSTDGTAAILGQYDDARIKRYRNDQVLTLTQSLNKGLAYAEGEFVARLDADDIALPERLKRQVAFLDVQHEVDLVGSGWIDLLPDGTLVHRPPPAATRHDEIVASMAAGNPFVHSTLMMRRQAVMEVGGYPQNFAFAQDFALYQRLVAAGRQLAIMPQALVHLRHHVGQFSVRPETALLRAQEEDLLLTAASRNAHSARARRANRNSLASVRFRKGGALWRLGRRAEAFRAWIHAAMTAPLYTVRKGTCRLLRRGQA